MNLLAIETSSSKASIALATNQKNIDEVIFAKSFSQAEILNVEVDRILQKHNLQIEQIDSFAVGIGPGSFTGIRVGINFVKTAAYLLKKPIYVLSSLDNLLLQEFSGKTLAAINAFNNKIYVAESLGSAPEVWTIDQLSSHLSNQIGIQIVGDAKLLLDKNSLLSETQDFPSAKRLAEHVVNHNSKLKALDWKSVSPLYLRSLKAEDH